jgi:hypothetical protein
MPKPAMRIGGDTRHRRGGRAGEPERGAGPGLRIAMDRGRAEVQYGDMNAGERHGG